MRATTWKSKDFIKILKANGYERVRQNGDHLIFKNGTRTIVVTPNLNKMVAHRLIKENGLRIGD